MSLARKCDVCGKLYEQYSTISKGKPNGIMLIRWCRNSSSNYDSINGFDLCPSCMKRINDLLMSIKEETEEKKQEEEVDAKIDNSVG